MAYSPRVNAAALFQVPPAPSIIQGAGFGNATAPSATPQWANKAVGLPTDDRWIFCGFQSNGVSALPTVTSLKVNGTLATLIASLGGGTSGRVFMGLYAVYMPWGSTATIDVVQSLSTTPALTTYAVRGFRGMSWAFTSNSGSVAGVQIPKKCGAICLGTGGTTGTAITWTNAVADSDGGFWDRDGAAHIDPADTGRSLTVSNTAAGSPMTVIGVVSARQIDQYNA